jgi:transcriptional regulator with XRE-family HTH domain
MELTEGAVLVMSPVEMREIRKLAGWTLAALSEHAEISLSQLSLYESGKNGLTVQQVSTCRRLLLSAAAERAQRIAVLFAREHAADLARRRPGQLLTRPA